MRYYLLNESEDEIVIDMTRTIVHSSELAEFQFQAVKEGKVEFDQAIFIKSLANQYFASTDGVRWSKLARQDLPKQILNIDQVYSLYRGFKPSGITKASQGGLLTQMPGKVVKIMVKMGEKVKNGQTLVILEAMKMENEIKCTSDGVIKAIHVSEGQALEQGVLMLEVEAHK
jgi:biotin carboxyl carrier protein